MPAEIQLCPRPEARENMQEVIGFWLHQKGTFTPELQVEIARKFAIHLQKSYFLKLQKGDQMQNLKTFQYLQWEIYISDP